MNQEYIFTRFEQMAEKYPDWAEFIEWMEGKS